MTTTEIQTKNYERLDGYIDKIVGELQTAAELMKEYFNAANEEGMSEDEAKKYLKSRIPHSTYYKYLPAEITKRKYTVDNSLIEESSSEFDTKGMGVVDPEPESSSESATDANGGEVEREREVESIMPIPNAEFPPEEQDFRAMYQEVVRINKELNAEIEDNHKAMEEMRNEVKALIAKNPTLGANPDIIQNQHSEIKKLLSENDLLRKSQKPVELTTSSELAAKPKLDFVGRTYIKHNKIPDLLAAIKISGVDGDIELTWTEEGAFIECGVLRDATETEQEQKTA